VIEVAVFASGAGTTFQALLDHSAEKTGWRVAVLVTDRPGAGAIDRARSAGVAVEVINDRNRPREVVVAETLHALRRHRVKLVLLAGYLRLVPPKVVEAFDGRMLNVHPALLPSFGGQGMYGDRVHASVLEAGAQLSGPTVHLVTTEYDRGRPLAQWPVPVRSTDDVAALRDRVQAAERALYPLVVDHAVRALRAKRAIGPLRWSSPVLQASSEVEPDVPSIIKNSYD